MLAIRPPNEWPPIAAPGSAMSASWNTATARSGFERGRSSARATIPCPASDATQGRIEAAVPDAPWPRNSRTAPGSAAGLRLLTLEHRERCRLHDVGRARRTARQPGRAHECPGEQDAAAAPERKPGVDAVERTQHRRAERHSRELVEEIGRASCR